jgi:hypothetical protein
VHRLTATSDASSIDVRRDPLAAHVRHTTAITTLHMARSAEVRVLSIHQDSVVIIAGI